MSAILPEWRSTSRTRQPATPGTGSVGNGAPAPTAQLAEHGTDERFVDATATEELLGLGRRGLRHRTVVACSMAADTVLPALVRQTVPGVDVLFLDTGYHFAETIGTRDALASHGRSTSSTCCPEHTVAEQDAEYGGKLFDRDPAPAAAAQGRAAGQGAAGRLRGLGHRHPPRGQCPARQRPARRMGPDPPPGEDQPDRRVELRRRAGLRHHPRRAGQPPAGRRLPVDRLRPLHAPVEPGEDPRAGRWAGLAKTECGIHLRAPSTDLDLPSSPRPSTSSARTTAELERPVLLFSGGKDSVVMLRLAQKAFWPARIPFPVMHVDTGHNFPEVIDFRDQDRRAPGPAAASSASVEDYIDDGRLTERPTAPATRCRPCRCWTPSAENRFDAVFGGGRRDEEKARAKERIVSLRDEFGQWDPRNQRPELWNLYNPRHAARRARARVPAEQLDRAGHLALHRARTSSCPACTTPTSARSSRATACG